MPAKGWRKDTAKSQVVKVRLEPEFAERLVREAGEGEGNLSRAVRTATLAGLDALDRRRMGLDAGGLRRVELTPKEEAVREEQAHLAAEALRHRLAKDADAREVADAVVARLAEGPARFMELFYAVRPAMRPPRRELLQAALRLLVVEGRAQVITVGAGTRGQIPPLPAERHRPQPGRGRAAPPPRWWRVRPRRRGRPTRRVGPALGAVGAASAGVDDVGPLPGGRAGESSGSR